MKIKDLKLNEKYVLSALYCKKEFPYCYITLKDAIKLGISKPTAIRILKKLCSERLITAVKTTVVFYYPVDDLSISNDIRLVLMENIF